MFYLLIQSVLFMSYLNCIVYIDRNRLNSSENVLDPNNFLTALPFPERAGAMQSSLSLQQQKQQIQQHYQQKLQQQIQQKQLQQQKQQQQQYQGPHVKIHPPSEPGKS